MNDPKIIYHNILDMSDREYEEFLHAARQMSGESKHDEFYSHVNLKPDRFKELIGKNVTKHKTKKSLTDSIKGGRLKIDNEEKHNETSFSAARVIEMLHQNYKTHGGIPIKFNTKNKKHVKRRNVRNDYSREKVLLTKEDKQLADLLKTAYKKERRPQKYLDYNYEADMSDSQVVTYVSDTDVIVAISGTHLSNPSDIVSDMHIAFGNDSLNDPRFEDALEITMKVKETYPKKKLHIVSHSLGSNVAMYVSNKINVEGTTNFNPYFTSTKYHNTVKDKKHRFFVNNGDIVGRYGVHRVKPNNLTYFHRNVTNSPFDNHKLDYFVNDFNKNVGELEKIKYHKIDTHDDYPVFDPRHKYPEKDDADYVHPKDGHDFGFSSDD